MELEASRRIALVVARVVLVYVVLQEAAAVTLAIGFRPGVGDTVSVLASRTGAATVIPLLIGAIAIWHHDAGQPTRSTESLWLRALAVFACAIDLALVVVVITTDDARYFDGAFEVRLASILGDALAPAVLAATAGHIARRRVRPIPIVERAPRSEDDLWAEIDEI